MKYTKAHEYGYRLLEWIFILSGTRLYMNWLLPTNPSSKNRFFRKSCNNREGRFNVQARLSFCYQTGGIHVAFAGMFYIEGMFLSPINIFLNLYPIMIQIYMFARCTRINLIRRQSAKLYQNKSEEQAPAPV